MAQVEVVARAMDRRADADGPGVLLEVLEERITLRELIRRTVQEQIRTLEVRQQLDAARVRQVLARQYLSAREIEKQAREGRIGLPGRKSEPRPVDAEDEIRKALRAFEAGKFLVIVGGQDGKAGRPCADLDEPLSFAEQTRVTFLRLVPLVGG